MRVKLPPTLRQTVRGNRNALDGLAKMTGREPVPLSQTEQHLATNARGPIVNRTPDSEKEAAVLAEVIELLAKHPAIIFAVRQNGGAVDADLPDGDSFKIWFYRWVRKPQPMRVTDIWGLSHRGMFALECKRRDWEWRNPTVREREQRAFFTSIRLAGGWGGFVTSAEQALALIEGRA